MYTISIYIDGRLPRQQAIELAHQELGKMIEVPTAAAFIVSRDQKSEAQVTTVITRPGASPLNGKGKRSVLW